MQMIGYFEGIDSKRTSSGTALIGFAAKVFAACKLGKVPDHSWLSKKRGCLPHEVDEKVFELKIGVAA